MDTFPRRVNQYEILEAIGQGGMGTVYRARDTRLERLAAIKVVTAGTLTGDTKARFLQEARAVSSLDHENICTIYELGESTEGVVYLAMAYYYGETLAQRLERGPLSLDETCRLGMQLAEGLAYAHARGIVHRDIKPANIMLTHSDRVKILDFGLAIIRGELAAAGESKAVGGTPGFMPPEQVRGKPLDHRADLWALGAVLYACLVGRSPFAKPSIQRSLWSVLHEEAPAVQLFNPEVPPLLAEMIGRALDSEPARRPRSAVEMSESLRFSGLDGMGAGASAQQTRRLVVLPFADLSPEEDQEFFCDGLTDELIATLAPIPGLSVVSRTSAFQFKRQQPGLSELAEKLKVDAALEGSVRKAGNRLRITAQLLDVAADVCLWSERFDREMSDVLEVQDEIALRVARALEAELLRSSPPSPADRSVQVRSFTELLRARQEMERRTPEALARAIQLLERSVELDGDHARAHAILAECRSLAALYGFWDPHEAMPAALQAARRAVDLDRTAVVAWAVMGLVHASYDYRPLDALRCFQKALALDPGDPGTRRLVGNYHHLPARRFAQAEQELLLALELDPLSPMLHTAVGVPIAYSGDHERAMDWFRRSVEMDPSFAMSRYFLGRALSWAGRHEEALEQLEVAALDSPTLEVCAALLTARALAGAPVREILGPLQELAQPSKRGRYRPQFPLAMAYLALGDRDNAYRFLERAFEKREPLLVFLRVHPGLALLREEARFLELQDRLGFQESSVKSSADATTIMPPDWTLVGERSKPD